MKRMLQFASVFFLFSILSPRLSTASAQGTAFTYQGQLQNSGSPASGTYNLEFSLYSAGTGGTVVAGPVTNSEVAVSNGLFTVVIDFGAGVWNGQTNWLQISVTTNTGTSFTALSPRQQVTPAPYAITAENFSGVVAESDLPSFQPPGYATIGGGSGNTAATEGSTVGGGFDNSATANYYTTIAGGVGNKSQGYSGTIAGGYYNTNTGGFATIGGGGRNTASGEYATVGGGNGNIAFGIGSFVGGGGYDGTTYAGNQADGFASVIGGGLNNYTDFGAYYACIGGGNANSASSYSFVGGGGDNQASGNTATVAGGEFNTASGNWSTIPGGATNEALGNCSFAAGSQAEAANNYSFVWSDGEPFSSTANNQFLVQASGGVGIGTNFPQAQLQVSSFGNSSFPQAQLDQLNPAESARLRFTVDGVGSKRWDLGATATNFTVYSGSVGANMLYVDSSGLTVHGTFVSSSDRNAKENFTGISVVNVLDKVLELPITEWNFKDDPGTRHLGPMAQDFYAAFNVGPDDKHIATVDEGGVALAAIQGLNQKLNAKDAEIQTLKSQNKSLAERLNDLEAAVKQLETRQ